MFANLVAATTPDGIKLHGALHSALGPQHSEVDLAIGLHGVGQNFYTSSVIEGLVAPLTSLGIPFLRVNTRGHDNVCSVATKHGSKWQGAALEIVDDCRLDLLGWLHWASEQAYRKVLLVGHSLGAIKAIYASAHESLANVIGVAALSPPRLSYVRFHQGEQRERFNESLAIAQNLVAQGQPESLFLARFPFPLHISGGSYLDKYGPGERYNFFRFVAKVSQPLLFTYGELELTQGEAFNQVVEELQALGQSPARLRIATIAGADHSYRGELAALSSVVVDWIQSLRNSHG